ncbi:MAG: HpcH/HpaI aldolase/citrate lyase family protein [Cupriavidus necator]
MLKRKKRARRVQLAVPGSNERMMAKAAASRADHVFLDLEDAVAPSEKPAARDKVIHALNTLDWSGKTRCVRINDLGTHYAHDDIIRVVEGARENLDVIMIPKVFKPADVYVVEVLLNQLEKKLGLRKSIGLELLIEETEALVNVDAIARSSDRLEAIILGMGDFSASQGIDLRTIGTYPGDLWHFARFKVTCAARAAGIDAIDGPYGRLDDLEGYREQCKRALALGMVGKWALHPKQVDTALEVFTPAQADVDTARGMIAAYKEAEARGLGAANFNGELVDAATVRIYSNVLQRAEILGL